MKVRDKYINIFGQIETLAEPTSWSTGISNMLEWLTWSTRDILGITKTEYRKLIIKLSHDETIRNAELADKQQYVVQKLDAEILASEKLHRYDRPTSSLATPREALRRAKYFSEEYLNKEFDIFWSLVSDRYLDTFYSQFTKINGHGKWFTHGNSSLFMYSTDIQEMQMDNLSYNPSERLLVANELKLGGKKNPDQILKYSLMHRLLKERGFIAPETRFLLLFIGEQAKSYQWDNLIEHEIQYCQKSTKSTARTALEPEGIEVARNAEYAATTWNELLSFNDRYTSSLDMSSQQVEYKLLWGFNKTLSAKAFMQD